VPRVDGEISREEFDEAKTAAQTDIYKIEEKLRFLESNLATAEPFVHSPNCNSRTWPRSGGLQPPNSASGFKICSLKVV
jgi:hypothetical protein